LEALVTRHELTRGDVITLGRMTEQMAAGFDREVAGLREEAARVEDQASDAAQRLAGEVLRTRNEGWGMEFNLRNQGLCCGHSRRRVL
jgi:hypothetical protein